VFEAAPIFSLLARALDNAALRQAVHTTNIANAGSDGFQRLEVTFDAQLQAFSNTESAAGDESSWLTSQPRVVTTGDTVRLDQEMALMAKDAVRYQALLGAFDRTTALLRLAIREGKES
jgi:flagellar basal-body rod protein FlgB